jgi:hypothetical protein
MRSRCVVWTACVLAVVLSTACGQAQTLSPVAPQPVPQPTADTLHAMSRLAGVIFAGQVIAVRRHEGVGGATGVVEIDFAVDQPIRGISGSAYTLREWAGLWPAGEEPFRAGQRYLMLLHAPGPAGLTSPVGGSDGAIPIRGADSAQSGAGVIDLRWVATGVARPISYAPTSLVHPTGRPVLVHPNAVTAPTAADDEIDLSAPLPTEATAAPAAQNDTTSAILAMLQAWEKGDRATR